MTSDAQDTVRIKQQSAGEPIVDLGVDDEVLVEPGVVLAHLGVLVLDQQPQSPGFLGLVGELEADQGRRR